MDMIAAKQNITAREVASELTAAIDAFLDGKEDALLDFATKAREPYGRQRLYECLAKNLAAKFGFILCKDEPIAEAMNDEEARQFEKQEIPYGAHKGKLVKEVDPSYWCRILEDSWPKQLRRYHRSLRFLQRQG